MINFTPKLRTALLSLYYFVILLLLLWMETSGSYDTPKFIYQGF